MDGKQFLGTARFLLHNGSDEADYRSAISRAYYACFIATRDLTFAGCDLEMRRKAGKHKEEALGHKDVQFYLKNASTETAQSLGEELSGLHGNRIDADYKMKQKMIERDAQDALEIAEAFLDSLSEASEDVKKAMDEYLRKIHS